MKMQKTYKQSTNGRWFYKDDYTYPDGTTSTEYKMNQYCRADKDEGIYIDCTEEDWNSI